MKRKLRYSHMDVLIADPVKPTPEAKRTHQLTRMWQGLHALTTSDKATIDDWAVVSDAINLMETLLEMGWMQDLDGALDEAAKAMSDAGERHQNGAPLRLTDEESEIIRGTLEDYAGALESLSHRVMVSAHRKTQQRIYDILDGKLKPHDVRFI